jgi:hypothetical protein
MMNSTYHWVATEREETFWSIVVSITVPAILSGKSNDSSSKDLVPQVNNFG